MRLFFPYNIIILIGLVLFSCAEQNAYEQDSAATENNKTATSVDNIGEEYFKLDTNISLTTEQKKAFQLRAIEKFQDFLDYIKLISDQKVDEKFKNHTVELTKELFINDTVIVRFPEFLDSTETLNELLSRIKNYNHPIITKVKHLEFNQPLLINSSNNYEGIMQVDLKIGKTQRKFDVLVYVINIHKTFGDTEQEIAEVQLGRIY